MFEFALLPRAAKKIDKPANRIGFMFAAVAVLAIALSASAHAGGYRWTGFYAGLHGGGTWSSPSTDIPCRDDDVTGICAGAIADGAFITNADSSLDGFIGGGQVGYNLQTGSLLFGVEADFSGTTVDGSFTDVRKSVLTTMTQGVDWLGTVRGRLGFVDGGWLLYGTGGLAYGRSTYDFERVYQPTGDYARASGSATKVGWTAGGGIEYAFGGWTLRTEYLYYDLGQEQLSAELVSLSGDPTNVFLQPDFETNGHIVRAGVNFPIN